MHRRQVLAGALAAVVGGWAAARADPATIGPGLELLEPVYAISAAPTGLTLRVASSGCTTKSDFAFYVRRVSGQTTVAFGRQQAERCKPRGAGGHVDLIFSYAELGVGTGTPLTLLNPLTAEPRASARATKPRRNHRR